MSEHNVPVGWTQCALGEYLYLKNGFAFKSTSYVEQNQNTVPIIRISDIDGRFSDDSSACHVNSEFLASGFEVEKGDLLIAMSGATTGKIGIYKGSTPAYQNQRVGNIKLINKDLGNSAFRNYLIHFLSTDILKEAYGGAQPNISGTAIENIQILLPPLAEQTRIAQKLDELLAQVDTLKARLDAIPALLKRFRQSALAAAVSGRLTEDWRAERVGLADERNLATDGRTDANEVSESQAEQQPCEWQISTFAELGHTSGGLTKNAKRNSLELVKPYLRVANVHANRLDLDEISLINLTEAEFRKTTLNPGDILIVEGNGSLEHIGRAAIWNGEVQDCCHQNHLIRWRAGNEMLPKFALYQLLSPQGRTQLIDLAKSTTGLHTLSISKISALTLPKPTLVEQTEIVRRVEQLFAFTDQLEAKIKTAQARVNHLTQSILAKAFRGELVPQDPNDEPASELLERIKAQRATAPKAKRDRKASA